MSREVDWNEVGVNVGWGVLRGKRCIVGGPCAAPSLRLFGLHGWLDNANTFDRLVPFLPAGTEVFVLDLPGHGFSDHLPNGAQYTVLTYVINLRAVVLKLEWKSFIFIAHSLGSWVALYYLALYPTEIKAFINFDFVKPDIESVNHWRWEINLILENERKKKVFGVYSEEEAIERLVKSRMYGPNKDKVNVDAESARILLPRSTKIVTGGLIWRHDHKARGRFKRLYAGNNLLYIVEQIKCPVLLFHSTNGLLPVLDQDAKLILDALRNKVRDFNYVRVDGPHHVHLTNPLQVAPVTANFLSKFIKSEEYIPSKL